MTTITKAAATSVPVHALLGERWSPRGFDAGHAVTDEQLGALLEAARWAPSAGNSQPWRFLVTRRGEAGYDRLFGTLAPGNQLWAGSASALLLVAAHTAELGGAQRNWALYDTGQAVASLSVQAQHLGLSVHQMGGFDIEAARAAFDLAAEITPIVVVAIGRHDPAAQLPEPLASREVAGRSRTPLPQLLLPVPAAGASAGGAGAASPTSAAGAASPAGVAGAASVPAP